MISGSAVAIRNPEQGAAESGPPEKVMKTIVIPKEVIAARAAFQASKAQLKAANAAMKPAKKIRVVIAPKDLFPVGTQIADEKGNVGTIKQNFYRVLFVAPDGSKKMSNVSASRAVLAGELPPKKSRGKKKVTEIPTVEEMKAPADPAPLGVNV